MKYKFLSFFLLLVITGCAGSLAWHSIKIGETGSQADTNNKNMMNLEIGQLKKEVVQIMGPAARREAYQLQNNRNIEFLFYRTKGWSASESGDNDSHFTPLAFENSKLIGWGRNYYDNVVRAAVDVTIK